MKQYRRGALKYIYVFKFGFLLNVWNESNRKKVHE
jgi:hypothetical protein